MKQKISPLIFIDPISSIGILVDAPKGEPVPCGVLQIRSESVCLRCSCSSSVILLSASIDLMRANMTSAGQVDANDWLSLSQVSSCLISRSLRSLSTIIPEQMASNDSKDRLIRRVYDQYDQAFAEEKSSMISALLTSI